MSKVALIFGATGIVGSALAEELASKPASEWSKIIVTSRREPVLETKDDRIKFVSIDLEKSEDEIKQSLLAAGAAETTHMYFAAYIHSKSWDGFELCEKNTPIFKKALTVVDNIAKNLQRVLLQTGCKYYGIHVGPVPNPTSEQSPKHPEIKDNPDFYFEQEDFLADTQKGKKWSYTVERPSNILGVTRGNGMSIAPTVALYFLVQKELGRKAQYPGNKNSYKSTCDNSNAELIARFCVFMSTNAKAENEDFIVVDNGTNHVSWEQMWHTLGKYFGVEIEEPTFEISSKSKEKFPREYSLEEYMKDKQDVWKACVKKNGGDEKLWDWATWDFADAVFGMNWATGPYVMEKSKKLGWNNEIDALQSFTEVLDKMKRLKMIPQN